MRYSESLEDALSRRATMMLRRIWYGRRWRRRIREDKEGEVEHRLKIQLWPSLNRTGILSFQDRQDRVSEVLNIIPGVTLGNKKLKLDAPR